MKNICVRVYYPPRGAPSFNDKTIRFPGWRGFYKDVFSCVKIQCNLCNYRFRCYTSDSLLLDFEEALELYMKINHMSKSLGKYGLNARLCVSKRYYFEYDL